MLATDSSPAVLQIARKKLSEFKNVSFEQADAYSLEGVKGQFSCLFASDWWSHIPRSKIKTFLNTIAGKLIPGSFTLFLDMSWNDYIRNEPCFFDKEGNRVSIRKLQNGSEFRVVKNFPTEDEIKNSIIPFYF